MRKFTLEGKTILVTGASSGIGQGIAIACAEQGAKCILVARNEERLKKTASLCVGGAHLTEIVDVADFDAVKSLVDRIPAVDGVAMCAGVTDNYTPLKFLSPELIDKVLDVNLKSPIILLATLEKRKKLNNCYKTIKIVFVTTF